jgi:chemotaxis protein CheX
MEIDLKTELYNAAMRTFENLTMMLPSDVFDDKQEAAEVKATVTLQFTGQIRGRLVVSICGDILPEIAENMLGEDSPPDTKVQLDALGEIANVICGNVLPCICGTRAVLRISAPEVLENPTTAMRCFGTPAASVKVGLEEGRADLYLYFDSAATTKEQ